VKQAMHVRLIAVALAAMVGGASWAIGPDVPVDGVPSLAFEELRSTEAVSGAAHHVAPYRFYDKLVVTVRDPVACGQHAVSPSFSLKGEELHLRYDLTPAAPGAGQCLLRATFTVANAPHRPLAVHFAGGAEPFVVAQLASCPFYRPTSWDRYECLVPAANSPRSST